MASLMDLDLKNVQPGGSFEPIPPGEYPAVIVSSEKKPTSTGGQGLSLKFQILNGQYQNRTVFEFINIVNKSTEAQNIGRSQLKSICVAVGVENPQHSEELHNRPLTIKVAICKDQNGNPRNEIKGYKSRTESNNAQAAQMLDDAFNAPAAPAAKSNPFAKQ
jgi:hypothetical protein